MPLVKYHIQTKLIIDAEAVKNIKGDNYLLILSQLDGVYCLKSLLPEVSPAPLFSVIAAEALSPPSLHFICKTCQHFCKSGLEAV